MSEPIETPAETIARLENVEVMLADDNERLRAKIESSQVAKEAIVEATCKLIDLHPVEM